jgi:hypothetical protein
MQVAVKLVWKPGIGESVPNVRQRRNSLLGVVGRQNLIANPAG